MIERVYREGFPRFKEHSAALVNRWLYTADGIPVVNESGEELQNAWVASPIQGKFIHLPVFRHKYYEGYAVGENDFCWVPVGEAYANKPITISGDELKEAYLKDQKEIARLREELDKETRLRNEAQKSRDELLVRNQDLAINLQTRQSMLDRERGENNRLRLIEAEYKKLMKAIGDSIHGR